MRTKTSLLSVVLACGCGGATTEMAPRDGGPCSGSLTRGTECGGTFHALATIENGLPYDACSFVVEVGPDRYAPDSASAALVREFTHGAIGSTKANIEYRLTGAAGQVECGWGSVQQLPEIAIRAISAP